MIFHRGIKGCVRTLVPSGLRTAPYIVGKMKIKMPQPAFQQNTTPLVMHDSLANSIRATNHRLGDDDALRINRDIYRNSTQLPD